jgi:hypothetical protein
MRDTNRVMSGSRAMPKRNSVDVRRNCARLINKR